MHTWELLQAGQDRAGWFRDPIPRLLLAKKLTLINCAITIDVN